MYLNIITNCTSLKKNHLKTITSFKEVMSLTKSTPGVWLQALKDNPEKDKAINVYAGGHWSIARDFHKTGATVWVISAGYGLINSNDYIVNYDATFNPSDNNHVGRIYSEKSTHLSNIRWWEEIAEYRQLEFGETNNISSLLNGSFGSIFIFALSPSYLKVIENELIILIKSKRLTEDNCLIISSKVVISETLLPIYIEAKADFCSQLGGNRGSLNIRLAQYLVDGVKKGESLSKVIRDKYMQLVSSSEPATKYNRIRLNDEQVKKEIMSIFEEDTRQSVSATSFLKKFREKGLACEQKRFSAIFKVAMLNQ